jgi:hypothetical protein
MEPAARAAGRARIQACFVYRGRGPAVAAGSGGRLMRGRAGMGVHAGYGTWGFRRAVAMGLLFPAMLPGASLSQGTVGCRCPGSAARCGR